MDVCVCACMRAHNLISVCSGSACEGGVVSTAIVIMRSFLKFISLSKHYYCRMHNGGTYSRQDANINLFSVTKKNSVGTNSGKDAVISLFCFRNKDSVETNSSKNAIISLFCFIKKDKVGTNSSKDAVISLFCFTEDNFGTNSRQNCTICLSSFAKKEHTTETNFAFLTYLFPNPDHVC